MYASVRPYTAGVAAASAAIITLGLVSPLPPTHREAPFSIEARVVQLAATATATGQSPRPPHTTAGPAAANPINVSVSGANLLAYFFLAFFGGFANLTALVFRLPIPFVIANPFFRLFAASPAQGATATNPAGKVVRSSVRSLRARPTAPEPIADTPTTAPRTLVTAGVGHPKNPTTRTPALRVGKKTAARAATTHSRGRSGRN